MSTNRGNLSVLLLQARDRGDVMREQEYRCFVGQTGLPEQGVVCHNLCEAPASLSQVRRHDALMVGGSGDYDISKGNLPGNDRYLDLLREVVDCGHPTFASCFGYQAMVQALGGQIVRDVDSTEIGTYTLTLTDEGKADPLFGSLPEQFCGQMGHKERVDAMPTGLPNLASTGRVRYQALRIPDKPIWASQFHPELDRSTNRERFLRYMENYAPEMITEKKEVILEMFRDSPESSTLLRRFLEVVFD